MFYDKFVLSLQWSYGVDDTLFTEEAEIKRWYVYAIAAILIFAAPGCGQADLYPVTLPDGVTPLMWTGTFDFTNYTLAQDLSLISSEGYRLATLSEVQKLFSIIGPFTPAMDNAYGVNLDSDSVFSAGIVDAGNGAYDDVFGSYGPSPFPPYYNSAPWVVEDPNVSLSESPSAYYDAGLWVVATPEPCTMLLVGSGLLALVAYRKRFMKV